MSKELNAAEQFLIEAQGYDCYGWGDNGQRALDITADQVEKLKLAVEALERVRLIRQDSGGIATRDLVNECVNIAADCLKKINNQG